REPNPFQQFALRDEGTVIEEGAGSKERIVPGYGFDEGAQQPVHGPGARVERAPEGIDFHHPRRKGLPLIPLPMPGNQELRVGHHFPPPLERRGRLRAVPPHGGSPTRRSATRRYPSTGFRRGRPQTTIRPRRQNAVVRLRAISVESRRGLPFSKRLLLTGAQDPFDIIEPVAIRSLRSWCAMV